MPKVELRHQRVSDAKLFFEILNNPKFIFWPGKPSSVNDALESIKSHQRRAKEKLEINFTILFDGKIVGACSIKIDQHRKHIGELGFFVDSAYWGRGIATEAVHQLEKKWI